MSNRIETKHEMLRAGYTFRSKGDCKGCGAPIEWWRTNNNKPIPYDPTTDDDQATVTPHWATCPKRDQFKSKAEVVADTRASREAAVNKLAEETKARAVVALYDDGVHALTWRNGIPGADLRDELITAGNQLRWQIDTIGVRRP